MSWIWVMLGAGTLAGLVQGVTGFGSGIMMMIFLPALLPIGRSAGVSTLTMVVANVMMVWRYRHALKWRRLPVPFLIYSAVATWSVHLGTRLPVPTLKALLGALLIAIATYFTLRRDAGTHRFATWVALVFMVVSGFFNGLFGIGGPLMALYFLTLADSKAEYLASIQTFFMLDTLYVTTIRFASGVLHLGDLRLVALGLVGGLLGTLIANRIVVRLDVAAISRLVYVFIGLSGAYYLLTALLRRA
ncbi:sulfite exporter TauE/SafE family protein [Lacticaseibacillus suihuaensis]